MGEAGGLAGKDAKEERARELVVERQQQEYVEQVIHSYREQKKAEEREGQHDDQDEEEAFNPKKTNKDIQPPQLKARLKSESEESKLTPPDLKSLHTENNTQTQSMGLNQYLQHTKKGSTPST